MDPRLNEFFNFVYTTILQSKRSIEEQHDLNFLQLINEKIESIESMLSVIINNYEDESESFSHITSIISSVQKVKGELINRINSLNDTGINQNNFVVKNLTGGK